MLRHAAQGDWQATDEPKRMQSSRICKRLGNATCMSIYWIAAWACQVCWLCLFMDGYYIVDVPSLLNQLVNNQLLPNLCLISILRVHLTTIVEISSSFPFYLTLNP